MSRRMKFMGFIALMAILVFSAVAVYSWTVDVPKTGQTTCYTAAGAVCTCGAVGCPSGQDAEYGNGVDWPSPRFSTATADTECSSTSECVKDNLTGLVWFKAGYTPTVGTCTGGNKNWLNALSYVACLNTTAAGSQGAYGKNDWRLPNVNELKSLLNAGQGSAAVWLNSNGWSSITDVSWTTLITTSTTGTMYWANTTYAGKMQKAWVVHFNGQRVTDSEATGGRTKNANLFLTLPVRGGN